MSYRRWSSIAHFCGSARAHERSYAFIEVTCPLQSNREAQHPGSQVFARHLWPRPATLVVATRRRESDAGVDVTHSNIGKDFPSRQVLDLSLGCTYASCSA